jgi:hypothetical protein
MSRHRTLAFASLSVLALAVFAGLASAGPPGSWTRLPGTVINFAEPGLARTDDGVLHVLYVRKNGTKEDLVQTVVAPDGKVGANTVAFASWAGMSHPDLVRMPDGSLRVFFGGIRSTNAGETNNSMNTATAPKGGSPWSLQDGKAAQATNAYATTVAGAGLAKDGTPISAWSTTFGVGVHYGTSPSDPDIVIKADTCCFYNPDIGVDAASGQAWVAYYSNQKASGIYAQALSKAGLQGARALVPGSVTDGQSLSPDGRTVVSGRIGAPGVFTAYGRGYPTFKSLALLKLGSAAPQIVIPGNGLKHVNLAAAPEGRLWLLWVLNDTVYATRTNRAATRVGPPTAIKAPGTVYRLNGEGSAGPLDVIANLGASGQAFFHQQVWPKLQLSGKATKTPSGRKLTLRVTDAGDPVAGATVKVAGKTATTAANGTATITLPGKAKAAATAAKAGYTGAKARV